MDNNSTKQKSTISDQSVIENEQSKRKSKTKPKESSFKQKLWDWIKNAIFYVIIWAVTLPLAYKYLMRYERRIVNHEFEVVQMKIEGASLKDVVRKNDKLVFVFTEDRIREDVITKDGQRYKGEAQDELKYRFKYERSSYISNGSKVIIDGIPAKLSKSGKNIKVTYNDGDYYLLRPMKK